LDAADQSPDAFLDMLAGLQARRMDDQRALLPELPGLSSDARTRLLSAAAANTAAGENL
jgi:hypothetical protein